MSSVRVTAAESHLSASGGRAGTYDSSRGAVRMEKFLSCIGFEEKTSNGLDGKYCVYSCRIDIMHNAYIYMVYKRQLGFLDPISTWPSGLYMYRGNSSTGLGPRSVRLLVPATCKYVVVLLSHALHNFGLAS